MEGQVSTAAETAELLGELDTILLELRRRLDTYLETGRDDIIAADEGFRVARLVHASTEHAANHAAETAAALERSHGASGAA
jgi:hypothetical protein